MPKNPKNNNKKGRVPATLKPFTFHGVELNIPKSEEGEALGKCPFCGGDKFSVNIETSKFKCWKGSCNAFGNSNSFLKQLWDMCRIVTKEKHFDKLAENSNFLSGKSVKEFGCALNPLNNNWVVPGYNVESKLTGLYRFCRIKEKDQWKNKLLPTPGAGHHLFNVHNYDPSKNVVDLVEGWRDAISWQETIKNMGLLKQRNILAVPGTNSFKPQWSKFFSGKKVNILFDNDWPRANVQTGEIMEPAGIKGVKRVASILSSGASPPESINHLRWDNDPRGFSESIPDGMDIRDFLSN